MTPLREHNQRVAVLTARRRAASVPRSRPPKTNGGTGFTDAILDQLMIALTPMRRNTSVVANTVPPGGDG